MSNLQLRTWQVEAFERFLEEKVMIAEVATGCGKTFFAASIIKEVLKKNPEFRVLIAVPKIVIMNGWLKELYEFFDITELSCYGDGIKEYSKITITTTASLNKMEVSLFDFIIVDEAHNFYSKRLTEVLQLEHWKYKLALSATIYSDNYKHLKLERIFRFNKYKYGIKEGLRDKILNPFEWYNHSVELDIETAGIYHDIAIQVKQLLASCGGFDRYVRMSNEDPRKSRLNKLFDERNKLIFNYSIKFVALSDICIKNRKRKIIIFNQYNAIGNKIVEQLRQFGLDARIVNSEIDEKEKRKRIKDYNDNKYNVLVTSKMFDEGYNLPAIDTAIIFSGESGLRQSIQRVGRVLRLKKYNSKIYQIYCKDTFENRYANKRSDMFKELAEKVEEIKW